MNPLLYTDFYKTEHDRMYPKGTTLIYSNLTPRKSRLKGVNKVVVFGIQHFIIKYFLDKFVNNFFKKPLEEILEEYKRHVKRDDYGHIIALHKLGYLPIEIKALPEGTLCPIGVPILTIKNTHLEFYWLTNYLETLISCQLWQPITSATIANEYKKILSKYAKDTTGSDEFVTWQGHDFSMRGMSSLESSILSGMGHLLSFTGTDSIPAIYALESSYAGNGLIGASVPATEHSVMCMGTKGDEIGTFRELMHKYPAGILSVVSDTWDLWKVCTEYLPQLKEEVLKRDGKLVIRPDSGDPVKIITGYTTKELEYMYDGNEKIPSLEEQNGVIDLLWNVFGGTINEKGYKVLDPHIGTIYGDSITTERATEICERLKAKGFASTNIVFGIGSYTYQYNTRDTFGFAMKATYGEITTHSNPVLGDETYSIEAREIFKDPITDDGTKRSKKGLLSIHNKCTCSENSAISCGSKCKQNIYVKDQQSWEEEEEGLLETVFLNGNLVKSTTLEEIREKLNKQNE